MVILGIDPGYAIVGWGVIDYTANRFQVLAFGAVTTEAKTPFNERLETVYDGIQDIINKYKPEAMAICHAHASGSLMGRLRNLK